MFEYLTLLFVIIILLIITIILSSNKVSSLNNKTTDIDIPRFSVNVVYEEYPTSSIDIENQYDCNVTSLRPCRLDDSTTLFGCKELAVRCQHFKEDAKFESDNGETILIPKNDDPNEGYALAVTLAVDSCNPYHGQFTLISDDIDSKQYMLICTCQNPGYIGNNDILGNCTTAYICDGAIDDINKPLNQIECKCAERETNSRYDDGVPVCKELTVNDANDKYLDWTHLVTFASERTLPIDAFNNTIKGNMNIKKLLNPCTSSLIDATVPIPNSYYNPIYGSCSLDSYGIPIENGMLKFNPQQTNDKYEPKIRSCDAVLDSKQWSQLRFTDNLMKKRLIMSIMIKNGLFWSIDPDLNTKNHVIDISGFGLKKDSQIYLRHVPNKFRGPRCEGNWPTYNCANEEYYVGDRKGDFPVSGHRDAPGAFLWKWENWDFAEKAINRSFIVGKNTLYLHQQRTENDDKVGLLKIPQGKPYGIIYDKDDGNSGLAIYTSSKDFDLHKQIAT